MLAQGYARSFRMTHCYPTMNHHIYQNLLYILHLPKNLLRRRLMPLCFPRPSRLFSLAERHLPP